MQLIVLLQIEQISVPGSVLFIDMCMTAWLLCMSGWLMIWSAWLMCILMWWL